MYRSHFKSRIDKLLNTIVSELPSPLVSTLAGKPNLVDGQTLDPLVALGLKARELQRPTELDELTIAAARQRIVDEAAALKGEPIHLASVRDSTIPGAAGPLRVRVYRPVADDRPLATVLFFHGGGWVVGNLDTHDATCRFIADRGGVAVISVDYRLAPEHRYPAAIDDALAAFRYIQDNAEQWGVDSSAIAVAGDSAGANICAVLSQRLADANEKTPRFQLLLVPLLDFSFKRRSYQTFGQGYFLTLRDIDFYEECYLLPEDDRSDPNLSPLLAKDKSKLPPTYIAVAGFDPLRDEGEVYGQALADAGVEVTVVRQADLIHPFPVLIMISQRSREAMADAVGALRVGLGVTAHPRWN